MAGLGRHRGRHVRPHRKTRLHEAAAWSVASVLVAVCVIAGLLVSTGALSPSRAYAAASYVQSAKATNDTAAFNISTAAFASNTTAGNAIIVMASWASSASLTCSDNGGNTYYTITTTFDSVNGQALGVCYATNITSTTGLVVKATFSANSVYRRIFAAEYSGIASTNPVDVTSTNMGTATGSADGATTNAATTTSNGDLIFSTVMDDSGSSTATAGTGFTQRASQATGSAIEDKVQSTAGSVAGLHTLSNTDSYLAHMVAFRPAAYTAAGTDNMYPNAAGNNTGTGNATWSNSGTSNSCGTTTNRFHCLNVVDGSFVTTGTTTGETLFFNLDDTVSTFQRATGVTISVYAKTATAGDTLSFQVVDGSGNTPGMTSTYTTAALTTSLAWYTSSVTLQGAYSQADWNGAQIKITHTGTHVVSIDALSVGVNYTVGSPNMSQVGSIFENDDQSSNNTVDANSQQAAGNTAITGVTQGERITVRTQLQNNGSAEAANLGLFYDRGDGYWSQVRSSATPITGSGSGCADSNFSCSDIDSSATITDNTSTAIDSKGHPWISYYDSTNKHLKVATYVGGSNGNCTNNAWNCLTIGNSAGAGDGRYSSIAIDPQDHVWVAYYDANGSQVMIAENIAGSGCASSAWTCTAVKSSVTMNSSLIGDNIALAISPSGYPAIAFRNHSASDGLYFVQSVASGGDCTPGTWTGCASAIDAGVSDTLTLAFAPDGTPWIAVQDVKLEVLRRVGNSAGTGCNSSQWTCTTIETTNNSQYPSIAFAPDGNPWISYYYVNGTSSLRVAKYLAGATTGTGCSVNTWTCTTVDAASTDEGQDTSMAFDPSGAAWVAYFDGVNYDLRLARYVGSGGSGCGAGGSTAWKCASIDTSNIVGENPSLAFAADGTAWISELQATNGRLRVATLNHGGEITLSPSKAGNTNGVPLTTTHVDMTSVSDSAHKADSACQNTATYNFGRWFQSDEGNNITLPDGTSTAQCTEAAWTIDTSQAPQSATTYRFVVATKNSSIPGRQTWVGPNSVTNYPSMTTASSTTQRFSKDALPDGANCTDTSWTCTSLDPSSNNGRYSATAIDPQGNPWIAYYDSSHLSLRVAQYVGSGGTGCATSAWTCGYMDYGYVDAGKYISLAFDNAGNPWMSYYDGNNRALRVAKYVGNNAGTGCLSLNWTCTTVVGAAGNERGSYTSLAFDQSGTPWISMFDYYVGNGRLEVAHYVGSGGSGCALSSWTCTFIDGNGSSQDIGYDTSLAISPTGTPWISYYDNTNNDLKVARFVGNGGTGCLTGVTTWTCTSIDTTNDVGRYTSIAFDANGNPWISYYYVTGGDLRVAQFLGGATTGSGCAVNTWTCTNVDTTNNVGWFTSIAFDASGSAWVSYGDSTNGAERIARYLGGATSGTGCNVNTWSCTAMRTGIGVDTTGGTTSESSSLTFDRSGRPWVSFFDNTAGYIYTATMHVPPTQGSYKNLYPFNGRNARTGDGRYRLDAGLSPRPSTCSATANYRGMCGVATNDSDYDAVAAQANEAPIFDFAERSNANTSFPSYTWIGQSSVAASASNVKIEVYNLTTKSWVTLATNSTTGANTDFTLVGTASSGSASDYWEYDSTLSKYWTYYRVYQASSGSTETLKTNSFTAPANSAPTTPTTLVQETTGNVVITTGGWNNSTSVKFQATVADADGSDTDSLCVEAVSVTSSFTNTETSCGTGVAYSGTGVTATVTLTLANGTLYHWQARTKDAGGLYSSWASYGGNSDVLTAATDVGVDTAAPTAGAVYDGLSAPTESSYNNGSLTTISGSWTGFGDTGGSGIASYDYSIGTSAGATDVLTWTNTASASFTSSVLTLHTAQVYYVNVRAKDAAGNQSTVVSSPGQVVAPTLTFSLSSTTMTFAHLNAVNSFTDSQTLTSTVSTNAYGGYAIYQRATNPLTDGAHPVAMYGASYPNPTTWSGTGLGYTSSDTDISTGTLGNIFTPGATPKYAGISTSSLGDVIADHAGGVSGTPITNEQFTYTYKLQAPPAQPAGAYSTTLILSCLPSY